MSNRELVIDVVSKLPEDTSIEEIIERIAFVAGVNEAIGEADRGEGVPVAEVKERMRIWNSKSS